MDWLQLAISRPVVRRALCVAAVVGSLLIAINHGEALLTGDVSLGRAIQILLTVFVPYGVSTYSSVSAMRHQRSP